MIEWTPEEESLISGLVADGRSGMALALMVVGAAGAVLRGKRHFDINTNAFGGAPSPEARATLISAAQSAFADFYGAPREYVERHQALFYEALRRGGVNLAVVDMPEDGGAKH